MKVNLFDVAGSGTYTVRAYAINEDGKNQRLQGEIKVEVPEPVIVPEPEPEPEPVVTQNLPQSRNLKLKLPHLKRQNRKK